MDMSVYFPHLGLKLDYVARSFRIFGLEITLYGLLLAAGMLLGIAFVVMEAKRKNQNQDLYLGMMLAALAAGTVGARLSYAGLSWKLYQGRIGQIFDLRGGGMFFYGGLLLGCVAAALFCAARRVSFYEMADIACMGVLIGQIIGKWGCFFNREAFGEYTDSLLAMQLPLPAVKTGEVTAAMRDNLETIGGVSFIQVHPAFLYESLWCLALFLVLLVWRRKKRFSGEIFLVYLAGYGLGRFAIEWIRTDKLLIPGTGIGAAQLVSAVLFVLCTMVVWVRRVMTKKRAAWEKRKKEWIDEAMRNQEKASAHEDPEETEASGLPHPLPPGSGEKSPSEQEN